MTSFIALGDSFISGQGVGVNTPPDRTWTALLAAAIPTSTFKSYAVPGARTHDVRHRQLSLAPAADIAAVLVGLNDVARAGFEPAAVRCNLLGVAGKLSRDCGTVLLVRLHDPVRLFWVPASLRKLAKQRLAIVNAAIDEASALPGVLVLDLASIPALAQVSGWAVDRVHPSLAGHAAMASAAADVLRAAGHVVGEISAVPDASIATRGERARWIAGYGAPYLARNVRSFAFFR